MVEGGKVVCRQRSSFLKPKQVSSQVTQLKILIFEPVQMSCAADLGHSTQLGLSVIFEPVVLLHRSFNSKLSVAMLLVSSS